MTAGRCPYQSLLCKPERIRARDDWRGSASAFAPSPSESALQTWTRRHLRVLVSITCGTARMCRSSSKQSHAKLCFAYLCLRLRTNSIVRASVMRRFGRMPCLALQAVGLTAFTSHAKRSFASPLQGRWRIRAVCLGFPQAFMTDAEVYG